MKIKFETLISSRIESIFIGRVCIRELNLDVDSGIGYQFVEQADPLKSSFINIVSVDLLGNRTVNDPVFSWLHCSKTHCNKDGSDNDC